MCNLELTVRLVKACCTSCYAMELNIRICLILILNLYVRLGANVIDRFLVPHSALFPGLCAGASIPPRPMTQASPCFSCSFPGPSLDRRPR